MWGLHKSILRKIIYLSYVTMPRDESTAEKETITLESDWGDFTSTTNKCFPKKIKDNKIKPSRTIKR